MITRNGFFLLAVYVLSKNCINIRDTLHLDNDIWATVAQYETAFLPMKISTSLHPFHHPLINLVSARVGALLFLLDFFHSGWLTKAFLEASSVWFDLVLAF